MNAIRHSRTPEQLFHHHLDFCEPCRTQPMNLCAVGAALLENCMALEATVNRHKRIAAYADAFKEYAACPDCKGKGEFETGIGMMACNCGGATND